MCKDVVLLLHTEPMVEVLVHTDGVSIERDEVLPCAVVHLQAQGGSACMRGAVGGEVVHKVGLNLVDVYVERDLFESLLRGIHHLDLLHNELIFGGVDVLGLEPSLPFSALLNGAGEEGIDVGFEDGVALLIGGAEEYELVAAGVVLDGVASVGVAFLRGAGLGGHHDTAEEHGLVFVLAYPVDGVCFFLAFGLFVVCRKQGVGSRLYSLLEEILKAQGIVNAIALITPPRTESEQATYGSMHFHEKMGYHLVGRIENSGYKFDQWFDTVYMEKELGTPSKNMQNIKTFDDVKVQFAL